MTSAPGAATDEIWTLLEKRNEEIRRLKKAIRHIAGSAPIVGLPRDLELCIQYACDLAKD